MLGHPPALAHTPEQREGAIHPGISAKGDPSLMGSFGNGIEPFVDGHPLELHCLIWRAQATSNYLDLK